jgi:prolyl oligopeptidase
LKTIAIACAVLTCAAAQAAPVHDPLAPVGSYNKPADIAPQRITETLFGRKVTDNYRFMEKLGPNTIDWMKAENTYTRSVLDAIKPRAALEQKLAAFGGSFDVVADYASYGGRDFYEQRAPGADDLNLLVRDAAGTRKLVDITALRAAHGGAPYAINYFLPSPDGAKVAVGISAGGSEDASIAIYDAATGKQIGTPLDRAQFGATAWSDDSKRVYVIRLAQLAPGAPGTDKYKNATLVAWNGTDTPTPILGDTVGHGPKFDPVENPALMIEPGATMAAAVSVNGVQNELALWLAPVGQVDDPSVHWTKFVTRADGVTSGDMRGNQIFLLSHKGAPTFQVLQLTAGEGLGSAQVLVPAAPDRVIDSIHAAKDALYIVARRGAYSELLRAPAGGGAVQTVALPFKGHIDEAFTDPRTPGIAIHLASWTAPPVEYAYDPQTGHFTDLQLGISPKFDSSRFAVSDLQAPARDGVKVPLSLIQLADAKIPQIVLLDAYGSYGISQLAGFSPRLITFVEQHAAFGICHVRGGGELGEVWRLGGKDANKHNTWQDLIACGEYLIKQGITTKKQLFIMGGSAGGITMGRAMTERPDLFAGVLDLVPAANTLRAEFSPNGPNNVPEFGSIDNRQGFENLYAMDSIQHVRHGVQYPAVMITTGLNDPRVSPWEPAKFAAALLASGSVRPVLLRVDAKAGHGIGSTKSQSDALYADAFAFVFWRAGLPDWRPGQ